MPIGDLLAQITGQTSSFQSDTIKIDSLPSKRKPDVQLQKTVDKIQKTAGTNSAKKVSPSTLSPKVNTNLSRIKLGSGVSPSATTASKTTTLSRNGQTNVSPTGPQKPLKKGSYAEIMARGKAAHATLGQVGKIQHKTIERQPSKREREAQRMQKSTKAPSTVNKLQKSSQGQVRDPSSRDNSNGKLTPVPEKKIKKSAMATTGYAGTARPKTTNPNLASRKLALGSTSNNNRARVERYGSSNSSRYQYMSDEVDDGEGETDYESDLSDMEAAAFEVDEEEETAAKIARREDAEALAEENRLKREKEEKRKRLAAMAKSRGARSY
ncbi:hypothetical protein K3495_g6017 [Podosphaera aphanis]|nr:hypothetical protein K3495_g6017 [Podosphaera aphanis]